jgi:hypothetical protein
MKPRFLIDENINRAIQRQLRRQVPELEILGVGDPGAPPAGMSDEGILHWIEENQYQIIFPPANIYPACYGFVLVLG